MSEDAQECAGREAHIPGVTHDPVLRPVGIVLVIVGGIIPDQDVPGLKQAGVAAIFQPGTAMEQIVNFIRNNVKPRGVPVAG